MCTFLKQALKNLRQTGSLAPSSVFLARKMTERIDFDRPLDIAELGAGTGSITRYILSRLNKASELTSFEINPWLYRRILRIRDKRFQPVYGSVLDLSRWAPHCSVDHFISGIPLANMPKDEKEYLIYTCHRLLKPGGTYVQFQYSLNDYALLKRYFKNVKLAFTLLNFPPAFVYYAQKGLDE